MLWTHFILAGSILGGLAVALGAFGAHALKSRLSTEYLAVFETGVRYQMYHAIALLCVGLLATKIEVASLKAAGYLFISGSLFFSGSLYVLTLTGIKSFGIVTPFGGVMLVSGWFCLMYAVCKI